MGESIDLTVCIVGALGGVERAAIVALCSGAFGEDFSSLFTLVPPTTMHIRAFSGSRLVGHDCWTPRLLQPGPLPLLHTAYVDAVATDPVDQGRGIGSAVLTRLADETTDYQLRALSTARVSFYTRLGWQRWRGRVAVRTAEGLLDTPDDTVMVLPAHLHARARSRPHPDRRATQRRALVRSPADTDQQSGEKRTSQCGGA